MFTIVCLGDSITCEWDGPHYPTYWQNLCNQSYGKQKIRIISAGVNGETAADGFMRINQDVLVADPDLVTIMFGHNDIHTGIPPMRFGENLARIIDTLQEKSTAKIWLLSPNRVADDRVATIYKPYLTVMPALAKEKQITFIDVWSIFANQNLATLYPDDYLHPNAQGHQLIAGTLMKVLVSFKNLDPNL